MACCFKDCDTPIIVEKMPPVSVLLPTYMQYRSKDGALVYCMEHYMNAVRQYSRFTF